MKDESISTDTADRIIQQLEATKKEIEQFLGELNLDSTTAEQRYQALKEEMKAAINEIKKLLEEESNLPQGAASILMSMLSELRERLEKPEANTVKEIEQLIKGIKKGLKDLAIAFAADTSLFDVYEQIRDRLQRYKLKFEILKLKLALGKLTVKYVGKDIQYRLNLKIQAIAKFLRESKRGTEEKLAKARYMVNKVYSAFSKIHS